MAKFSTLYLDARLNDLISRGKRLTLCSADPADYTAATQASPAGVYLGKTNPLTGANWAALGDDGLGGRKTKLQAIRVLVEYSGQATHFALVDDAAGVEMLLWSTPLLVPKQVLAGNTHNAAEIWIKEPQPT